jgi:hypothetical protein
MPINDENAIMEQKNPLHVILERILWKNDRKVTF